MSGTSLDGLDIVHATFVFENEKWNYAINHARTIDYNDGLRKLLGGAHELSGSDLIELDELYGRYLGREVNFFIKELKLTCDFISSHGHTVYHDPQNLKTLQIGSGVQIANITGTPVINDFRTANVQQGGQGAPLVPIGDMLLFHQYRHCLNLGGIANISSKLDGNIQAYDIGICNIAFNHFASLMDKTYDEKGLIGQGGKFDRELLDSLNSPVYFHASPPKSLDASFFKEVMIPLIERSELPIPDQSRTFYEHLTCQISACVSDGHEVLVSGGGVHNDFLMALLKQTGLKLHVPSSLLVDFKEALIFAFMGVLRHRNEINCLKSVTGAPEDMSTGVCYGFDS
ncbi:MAG: anhydro-N-acetylmuramic acid kinase [Vicingaceae bacterium]